MRRLGFLAMLGTFLGCAADEGDAPGASTQPAFCEPGVRECPPLEGHDVTCEAGVCVARSPEGGLRGDCSGIGTFPDDLASDPRRCGACRRSCAVGAACFAGVCLACSKGERPCEGACRDLQTDGNHCGVCGVACRSGERCDGGSCVSDCPAPRGMCDGRCVDLSLDARHCGACGDACDPSEQCAGGACHAPCAAGTVRCGSSCADLRRSREHCGACGARCGVEHACVAGACVRCALGLTACDGVCADLQRDGANCGACGTPCGPLGACVEGRCRLPCADDHLTCTGYRACGVTFEVSANHCGACGAACPAGAICVGGRCMDAAPRMVAPLSTVIVTSARPWFRWEPDGAEGVRIEVCADRACGRLEHRWDAVGASLRAPEALRGGIHYWRLLARRGGVVSPPGGVVWEFTVPDGPVGPGAPEGARCDLNGDGLTDRFELRPRDPPFPLDRPLDVYLGASSGAPSAPSQVVTLLAWGGPMDVEISDGIMDPTYVGDLNGDGYGDVGVIRVERHRDFYMRDDWFHYHPVILFGGPHGLSPTQYFIAEGTFGQFDRLERLRYVGDRNGDGYGDAGSEHDELGYIDAATFGGPSPWAGYDAVLTDLSCHASAASVHLGDFDADGVTDVVTTRCAGASAPLWVYRGIRGPRRPAPGPSPLFGCGLAALTAEAARNAVRVTDHDGDGYDDLVVWTGATPTARALIRGGPDGLRRERCERLP